MCVKTNDQKNPAIYQNIVVWEEDVWIIYGDIYAYNISNSTEFQIRTEGRAQSSPAIYGDLVVWIDDRDRKMDIYGYNLHTREEFPIYAGNRWQHSPQVYRNIVVWTESANIYGYKIL
ncbi:MAG: hypothetical protein DRN08_04200 [Thermoplasmata archaeon]|nr:MAG: hypothetical protein DRN08_04200 [Thermoplasmata archaeon]